MAKGDMYLRLEGKSTGAIKGESNAAPHVDEIEVMAWSWGMAANDSIGFRGKERGGVVFSELRITKGVDRASTALMGVMRSNEAIKKAVLTVRKSGSNPPIDYLVITIERGRLTAFDVGTLAPGEPELVERLAIAFEKIDISYASQSGAGAKTASTNFSAETVAP
jgi:type VI secretion system secreted protein Hcp